MSRAQIVVGLGFGDEGKGRVTDHLCRLRPDSLVVRFSGGQQCGHHVCLDGRRHVHSSFGSGTLRGLPSWFSAHCCFYPVSLMTEHRQLRGLGVEPVLYLHPQARLTTPYDLLANRLAERRNSHGSCGLGIGKTMQREADGYALRALDTTYPALLAAKLNRVRDYTLSRLEPSPEELDWLTEELGRFREAIGEAPWRLAGNDLPRRFPNLVFEGSQGILLDQTHGQFPHVTYAHTTSRNAVEICRELGLDYEVRYVTRCYTTRHGPGWMPDERPLPLVNTDAEINRYNRWQGDFRTGELDYDALNHALAVDTLYSGGCPRQLVVTCLDQRPGFRFETARLQTGFAACLGSASPQGESELTPLA